MKRVGDLLALMEAKLAERPSEPANRTERPEAGAS